VRAFGKVSDLYGQEIKVQPSSSNYESIIKIFTSLKSSGVDTAYISQGAEDSGNISVRTAKNGVIELGASETSQNNKNLIPEPSSFLRVSKEGVQLKSKIPFIDNQDNEIFNSMILNPTEISMNGNKVTLSSIVTAEEKSEALVQIADDYT
jgi:hypothetical protein